MESIAEFNAEIIKEFRQNDGQLGGRFQGADFLILHTTGAKSGLDRLSPMAYLPANGRYYVFAVGHGDVGAKHPAWYHNLVANPDVAVEVGTETIGATATVLHDAERKRAWEAMIAHNAHFANYSNNHGIPAIALTLKTASSETQPTTQSNGTP